LRVLVCGGRDFENREWLYHELDQLHSEKPINLIIQGGAVGADRLAKSWANSRYIDWVEVPADWKVYGKSAGSIRNQRMLDEQKPDLVVAFPGGTGTADMVKRAMKAGVSVIMVGNIEGVLF